MKLLKLMGVLGSVFLSQLTAVIAAEKITVVCTFSDIASITKEITGDLANVEFLSQGDQDPHFVPPKPSLALRVRKADMIVSTGLDLEMWLATLQDKARNKKVMDGADGFVTVCPGLEILEKPAAGGINRSEGDVHVLGNPHFHTTPLNWIQMSENILIGLKRVDPQNADVYTENQRIFIDKVYERTYGKELVNLFGGEQLTELLRAGTLFEFLETEYNNEKLLSKLGGWIKQALPFRGKQVIAYHKNWAYFCRDFGLDIIGFIESKPGIPPTPKHVEKTIKLINESGIDLMLVASYFEKRKPNTIAQKTNIKALFLPLSVAAIDEVPDNFTLVDYWINQINNTLSN